MVVENAFGHLKGCWRCLLKRNDVDTALMSDVVAVCCVLHNICGLNKEVYLPDWNITDVLQEPDQEMFQGVGGHNCQGMCDYNDSLVTHVYFTCTTMYTPCQFFFQ